MDTKINIKKPDGSIQEAELLRVFENTEKTKNYLIYTLNEVDDNNLLKIYISEVKEESGVYSLNAIETDDEWTKIKELLRSLMAGGTQ